MVAATTNEKNTNVWYIGCLAPAVIGVFYTVVTNRRQSNHITIMYIERSRLGYSRERLHTLLL